MKKNILNKKSSGFTLLVAMIVTALILAIGFSIGNIILKELALSASGRRSQVAFYAADSIAECALYWDRKDSEGFPVEDSPFATSTLNLPVPFIQCGTGFGIPSVDPLMGNIANFSKVIDEGDVQNSSFTIPNTSRNATTTFVASFTDPTNPSILACGQVSIAKNGNQTVIEARGYNVGYSAEIYDGAGGCDTLSPKTVERGIKVDY